jgi:hypothetical protein
MKERIQGILIGVLLSMIIGYTLSYASQKSEYVQRFYRDIKIALNGLILEPKDANGNDVEPFIIDGTTYLPVRAVCEALDLKVNWNEETNMVELLDEKTSIFYGKDNNQSTASSKTRYGFENDNSTKTDSTSNESQNKIFNINARKDASLFSKGNIALTVTSYQTETNNAIVGGVKDGQEWVILNIKFENMSNSTVVIDKNDFKIVDGASKYGYRPYTKHLDTELDLIEIRAGQTASFSVRFVYYQNNEMTLRYYNSDLETHSYDDYIELKIR